MRLQVRVTPVHQELLEHLESIDKEYRGKRLVALAAMQLHEMKTTSSIQERTTQTPAIREQPIQEHPPATESDDNSKPRVQQRTAPKWLSGQEHEKE
ncbi:hypothetical protein [Azotobacter chroococcum]|uniref:Uncharacterized protein n=1 Tax=Azotobacter chroococcum TaxID=353 RepID=A0AAP9YGW9_9GAMM|nr:hypothetical protein [Azotobacter chroococcum]QQE91142.1 hypothetical protein GKQ51_21870 [Azotobacter chroococcum]